MSENKFSENNSINMYDFSLIKLQIFPLISDEGVITDSRIEMHLPKSIQQKRNAKFTEFHSISYQIPTI